MKKKSNQMGRAALVLVLGLSMTLTACSTDWVKQAEQVVAALIPASTNIVTLVAMLQGKSVSASDLRTIQDAGTQAAADLQLIQALIEAYQKADESAKPGNPEPGSDSDWQCAGQPLRDCCRLCTFRIKRRERKLRRW